MTRRRRASPLGLGAAIAVTLALVLMALTKTQAAPWQDITEIQQYTDGCYYNYNHYNEGDRILTNEPCLNCTCHNKMLMCYLRVCPFTKPIGHDCIVEKREDQCCPIITCPEVPVDIATHHPSDMMGTELSIPEKYGCNIGARFYPEGAQVPSNPNKPCELCYCIKNRTSCLMQECTLHIEGCTPIYNRGSCCPVRYNCDHENDVLEIEDHSSTSTSTTTTVRPTPGFVLSTTLSSSTSMECTHNGVVYADGSSLRGENPCEHCYCMHGDIVCAVQECEMPMLSGNGKSCQPVPGEPTGECCPSNYICKDDLRTSPQMIDTLPPTNTTLRAETDRGSSSNNTIKDLHSSVSQEDLQLQAHIDDDDGRKPTQEPGKLSVDEKSKNKSGSGSEGNILTTTIRPSVEDQRRTTVAEVLEAEEMKGAETTERFRESDSTAITSDSQELGPSETISDDSYTTISSAKEAPTESIAENSTGKLNELNQEKESTTLMTKLLESDDSTNKPSPSEEFSIQPTSVSVDTATSIKDVDDKTLRTTLHETTTSTETENANTEVSESVKEDLNEKDVEQSSEKNYSPKEATYPPNTEGSLETGATTTYAENDLKTSKTALNIEETVSTTTLQTLAERKTDTPTTLATIIQNVTEAGIHMVTSKTTSVNFAAPEEESLDSVTEASGSNESVVQITDNPLERKESSNKPQTPKPADEVDSEEIQSATENIRHELTTTSVAFDDEKTTTIHSFHKPGPQFIPADENSHNEGNSEYLNVGFTITTPEDTTDGDFHDFTTSATGGMPSITMHSGTSTSKNYDEESVTISGTNRFPEEETSSTVSTVNISIEPVSIKSTIDYQMTGRYPSELDKDHKRLNEGMIPEIIPGEGDCLIERQTYPNNSNVPSLDKCKTSCICRSSTVVCQDIVCQTPNDISKCIQNPASRDKCCPEYICEIESVIPSQTESNIEKEKETKLQYIPTNTSLSNPGEVHNENNLPTTAGELVKDREHETATEGFSIEIDVPTVSNAEAMSHVKDMNEDTISPERETESNQYATEKEEAVTAQTITSVSVSELPEYSVIQNSGNLSPQRPVIKENTSTDEPESLPQSNDSYSEEYKPQMPNEADEDISSSTDRLILPVKASKDNELTTDRSLVTTPAVEQNASTMKHEYHSSEANNAEVSTTTIINSINYGSDESQKHSEMTTNSVSYPSSSSSSKDNDNKSPNEENLQFTHSVNTKEHTTTLGTITTTPPYEESRFTTSMESLHLTERGHDTKKPTVDETEETYLLVSTGVTAEGKDDIPEHTTLSFSEAEKLAHEDVKYSGSGMNADTDISMLHITEIPTEKSTVLLHTTTRHFSEAKRGQNESLLNHQSETNASDDIFISTDSVKGVTGDQTSDPLSDGNDSYKHPVSGQNNEDELMDVSTVSPAEKEHNDISSEYTTHRFSEEDRDKIELYTTHENNINADDDLSSHTTFATELGENTPTVFHEYNDLPKHTYASEDSTDTLIGGYTTSTPTEKTVEILSSTIKYFDEEDDTTKYESSTNKRVDLDGVDDHRTLDRTTQPAGNEEDKLTNENDILSSTIAATPIEDDIKHTTYSISEDQEPSGHPTSEEDDINVFLGHTIIPTQKPNDDVDHTTYGSSEEVKILNEFSVNHEYGTSASDDVSRSTISLTEIENDHSHHTTINPSSEDKNVIMGYTNAPTLTSDYIMNHTFHSLNEEEITENEPFMSPGLNKNVTDDLLSSTISSLDIPSSPSGRNDAPSTHPDIQEVSKEEGMNELIDSTLSPTERIDDNRVPATEDHTPGRYNDEDLTEGEDGKNDLLSTTTIPTESPEKIQVYTTKDHARPSTKNGEGITDDDKNEYGGGSTVGPVEDLDDTLDYTTETLTGEEEGNKKSELVTIEGTESGVNEDVLSSTVTETKMKDLDALSHTSRPFSESDESVKHSLPEGEGDSFKHSAEEEDGVDELIVVDANSPTDKDDGKLDYTTKYLIDEDEEREGDKKKVEEPFNRPENESKPVGEIVNYTLLPKVESTTHISSEMANGIFDETSQSSAESASEHSGELENTQIADKVKPAGERLTPATDIETGEPTKLIVDKNDMDESTTFGSVYFESGTTTTSSQDVKFEVMDSRTDKPLGEDTVTPEVKGDKQDITKTPTNDAKEEEVPLTFSATATNENKAEGEDKIMKSTTTDTILTDSVIDNSHTKVPKTEISTNENEPSRIDDNSKTTLPVIDIRTEESVTDRVVSGTDEEKISVSQIMTHLAAATPDNKFGITDSTTPTTAATDVKVISDEINTTLHFDDKSTSAEHTTVRLPEALDVTTSIVVKDEDNSHDDNSISFTTNAFEGTESTSTISPHIVAFEKDSTAAAPVEHKTPLANDDDKENVFIMETTLGSVTEESVENWTQGTQQTVTVERVEIKENNITVMSTLLKDHVTESSAYETTIASQTENNEDTPYSTVNAITKMETTSDQELVEHTVVPLSDNGDHDEVSDTILNNRTQLIDDKIEVYTTPGAISNIDNVDEVEEDEEKDKEKEDNLISELDNDQENFEEYTLAPTTKISEDDKEKSTTDKSFILSSTLSFIEKTKKPTENSLINTFETTTKFELAQESAQSLDEHLVHSVDNSSKDIPIFGIDGKIKDITNTDSSSPSSVPADGNKLHESEILEESNPEPTTHSTIIPDDKLYLDNSTSSSEEKDISYTTSHNLIGSSGISMAINDTEGSLAIEGMLEGANLYTSSPILVHEEESNVPDILNKSTTEVVSPIKGDTSHKQPTSAPSMTSDITKGEKSTLTSTPKMHEETPSPTEIESMTQTTGFYEDIQTSTPLISVEASEGVEHEGDKYTTIKESSDSATQEPEDVIMKHITSLPKLGSNEQNLLHTSDLDTLATTTSSSIDEITNLPSVQKLDNRTEGENNTETKIANVPSEEEGANHNTSVESDENTKVKFSENKTNHIDKLHHSNLLPHMSLFNATDENPEQITSKPERFPINTSDFMELTTKSSGLAETTYDNEKESHSNVTDFNGAEVTHPEEGAGGLHALNHSFPSTSGYSTSFVDYTKLSTTTESTKQTSEPYSTLSSATSQYPHQPPPPIYGGHPPQYPTYPEDEYTDEDEAEVFGPGTCRYGGKLFVSAQQIPRDDPCDFCFCFRSDIICLQQSCPPPISGCHEEPISGFCCPRYECPVSMATVLNITTSTTTTSTTLPPHFLYHAYEGAAERNGCQIDGKSYKVGQKIDSASGPCMQCTCGGDGQMKCDPKTCSPEPMLRQMIAVVASRRR